MFGLLKKICVYMLIFSLMIFVVACSDDSSSSGGDSNLSTYELNVAYEGPGIVSRNPDQDQYNRGSNVELTALPESGGSFVNWTGDLTGYNNPNTITVNNDVNIVANFLDGAIIDLSSGSGSGTISNFSESDGLITVIFPQDDTGTVRKVGSFKVSNNTQNVINAENNKHTTDIGQYSIKEQITFDSNLRDIEKETIRKHNYNNDILRQEDLMDYDPQLGDLDYFYVLSDPSTDTFAKTEVELKAIGNNTLIWLATDYSLVQSEIDSLLTEFEDSIRPTDLSIFGREPNGDTFPAISKHGEKVNIVLADMPDNIAGYFISYDLYSSDIYSISNERKTFYVGYDQGDYNYSVLAHEYQHMIYYNEKVLSETPATVNDHWINEGFAMLAQDFTGYGYQQGNIQDWIENYLKYPENTSLINWEQDYGDYAASYLFSRYVMDRYGKDFITYLNESPKGPMEDLEDFTGLTFKQLFEDWALAMFLTSIDQGLGKYQYTSITLPSVWYFPCDPGEEIKDLQVKGWAILYIASTADNDSDIDISIENAATSGDFWLKSLKLESE